MGSISFAGKTFPVIYTTRETSLPNSFLGTPVHQGDITAEMVVGCTGLGKTKQMISTQTIESECTIGGGTTNLHNGAEVVVGGPILQDNRFVNRSQAYFNSAMVGNPNDWWCVPNQTRYTSYDTTNFYYGAAIKVEYVDGQGQPLGWSPSYEIVTAYRSIDVDPNSGGIVHDRKQFSNGIRINPCYWQRQYGIQAYFDEDEPTPEPEDPNADDPVLPPPPNPTPAHDPTSDPILIPNTPSEGAAMAGFVTMYKLTRSEMTQFAGDMYASNLWEAIKLFFSNPMDFIVGCMLVPFNPTGGLTYHPKFGQVAFAHGYVTVANQYVEIDCGSIAIEEYWGSCFDYEPYTQIQIWLPYIGYKDLPVDEVMNHTITVKYHCDCLTGDCVAFISTTSESAFGPVVPHVIAQYYGNCGVRVPYNSVSYDAAIAASIQLIGAIATSGLTKGGALMPPEANVTGGVMKVGGAAGGLDAAAGLVGNVASSPGVMGAAVNVVQGMKPTVQRSGAAGASSGYMSIQTPYLIFRRPWQSLPEDYFKFKGYPLNEKITLGELGSGFALVDDIQLNNIPAFEDERAEIIEWLKGGVLI